MADEKKFLDQAGVQYLWSRLSMEDYPNNETLIAVLNAIDATKANKDELFSGSWNDLEDKPFGEEILNESYVKFDGVVTNGKIDDEFWLANANHEPVNIRVIFDGVNYDFLNKDELADDFGDPNFVDYPFYIEPVYLGGAIGTQGKFTCIGGEHIVKIVGLNYTVSTIDPDYLPEGIAYIDYVNEQIAAIPTPDVSGQISTHNENEEAHMDIRTLINENMNAIDEQLEIFEDRVVATEENIITDVINIFTPADAGKFLCVAEDGSIKAVAFTNVSEVGA